MKEKGLLKNLFGRRQTTAKPSDEENELFRMRNQMLQKFDEIEKLNKEKRAIVDKASDLPEGDPRLIEYKSELKLYNRKITMALEAATRLAETRSIKDAVTDMEQHEKLLRDMNDALINPDRLVDFDTRIKAIRENISENSTLINDILRGFDNETGKSADGAYSAEDDEINNAREVKERLKDAERLSVTGMGETASAAADGSQKETTH